MKLVVGGKKIEGEGAGSVDDVIRRLEELHFGVNEIELSKEQIEINDQCQEDEVCLIHLSCTYVLTYLFYHYYWWYIYLVME